MKSNKNGFDIAPGNRILYDVVYNNYIWDIGIRPGEIFNNDHFF